MIAWFVHGWGFGPSFWDALNARLSGLRPQFANLGYFGNEMRAPPVKSAIWITHSFGTMHALASMPTPCRALVVLNGFDHFVAADGMPGVPRRVLDRMLQRFGSNPAKVVSDFRRECGYHGPMDPIVPNALERDLLALRDMDCRAQAASLSIPVLSLQGAVDPILPENMREAVFPDAVRRSHPVAGHLLPVEQPDWCAHHIARFLDETLP